MLAGRLRWGLLAAAGVLLSAGLAAQNQTYCVNIDYSKVPALVNYLTLTVNVNVGVCASVSVQADGLAIASSYNASTQLATFSTTGKSILVTAVNWTSGGGGAATKATLYNNYHWAYSQTFDDVRQSQYDYAKPILDGLGLQAGLAAVASWLASGNNYYMTWAEIRTLRAEGWDVYNHTWDHPNPVLCSTWVSEFGQDQTAFQAQLPGYNVTHTVFPYEVSVATCAAWPPSYLLSGELGSGGYSHVDAALPNAYTVPRNGLYGTDPTSVENVCSQAGNDSRPSWVICITHSVTQGGGAAADAYSTNQNALNTLYTYLLSNWGPTAKNTLWFAPAGRVQDYLFVRDNAVLSTCAAPSPTTTPVTGGTKTSTPSPTLSRSPSPTVSPSASSTASPTRSVTPSSTPTGTPSASSTASLTVSASRTASSSASATASPSATTTASRTASPSASATASPRATATASPPASTATVTATPMASPSITLTQGATVGLSATETAAASPAPSATLTVAPPTPTSTATASLPSATATAVLPTPSFTAPALTPTPAVTVVPPTKTETPTLTLAPSTPTPTSTVMVVVPTATGSPTATRVPPTASATASSTPSDTVTTTASPSPTWTQTAIPAPPTPTASPDSTRPGPGGPLVIRSGAPVPNPDPDFLSLELEGPGDGVTVTVFTPALVRVGSLSVEAALRPGRDKLPLGALLKPLPPGLYYLWVQARRADARSLPLIVKTFLTR